MRIPGEPALGFSRDGRTVLGGPRKPDEVATICCVKPDLTALGDVELGRLDAALHYHARGWGPLARVTFRRWYFEATGWTPELFLAWQGWGCWHARLYRDPGTPLPLIAQYLRRALPDLDGDNEDKRKLLEALERTLKARRSPPGSDEALIDDLVEVCGEIIGTKYAREPYRRDPRFQAVVRRGFEIVPALIAHLDDERLTRLHCDRCAVRAGHYRVGDVAMVALAELAGTLFRLPEDTLEARYKAVGEWFVGAQKLGEEQYVVSRVLDSDDVELKPTLFWLLCEKYPKRLPDVYRDLTDNHPELARESWVLAKAVAESPLPAADKQKILRYAAMQGPHHRVAGIHFLRAFDPQRAHRLLIAALAHEPTAERPDEPTVTWLVAGGADPDEWQALAKAVRRADTEGRWKMLHAVARQTAEAGRTQRLAFLAEYLTDDAVRDARRDPQRHGWSDGLGYLFPQLEIRNLAAAQLAEILGLDAGPEPAWTAGQWAELRDQVRAAVEKEIRR